MTACAEVALQSGTARAYVNVRSRCSTSDRTAEREIRDTQSVEQSKKPNALGLSGAQRHVNSILVIQSQRLVGQSLS